MDNAEIDRMFEVLRKILCNLKYSVNLMPFKEVFDQAKTSEVVFVDHGEPNGDMTCEIKGYYKDDKFFITGAKLTEPIDDIQVAEITKQEEEEELRRRFMAQPKTDLEAALRQYQKPSGSTSDGYHTFDELYHHRAVLFSALCYAYKDKAWRAKKHHDGSMFGDDWFVCGIETPQGQYSYHYELSKYWDIFESCKTLEIAPEWDGHEPKDVDRLLSLQQMDTEYYCDAIYRLKEMFGLSVDEKVGNKTFRMVIKRKDARVILEALQQMIPKEEQSTQSESQPCDVYELAVYKKLGITSERAYQLIEMEKSNNDI